MAVGDEPRHQIDRKVGRTAVARVFNLHEMLELIEHGFEQGTASQDNLLMQQQQAIGHVPFEVRHQAELARAEQFTREWLREVALVAKQAPPETLSEFGDWPPVIDVARRELAGEQLAMMVDHDMQLEAIKPAHGGFSALRQVAEDAVLPNTAVVTDCQRGRIHERQPAAMAQAGLEVGTERANRGWHQFHKALIADRVWKLTVEMAEHIPQVIGFEVAKAHLVEVDQDRQEFAHRQLAGTLPKSLAMGAQLSVPFGQK